MKTKMKTNKSLNFEKNGKNLNFKKTLAIIFIFLLAISGTSNANPYHNAMKVCIDSLNNAHSVSQFQNVANQFERIANTDDKKWLPDYYAAYSYIIMSFVEKNKDKKDQYLDKAQTFIDKSQKIDNNNSEIYVIQGYLYEAKIAVSPMSRGYQYSSLVSQNLNKAMKINPDNPRSYFVLGQNILYTPTMFGGGVKAAYPYLSKAQSKYKIFKPKTDIAPNWGQKRNLELIKYCNKQKNK